IRIDAPARTVVPIRSTVAPSPIAGGRGVIVTSCGAFFDGGVFAMNQRSASSGTATRMPSAWRAMLSMVVGFLTMKRLAERSAARSGSAIPRSLSSKQHDAQWRRQDRSGDWLTVDDGAEREPRRSVIRELDATHRVTALGLDHHRLPQARTVLDDERCSRRAHGRRDRRWQRVIVAGARRSG